MEKMYKNELSADGKFGEGLDIKFEVPISLCRVRFWYWVLLRWEWREYK